MTIIRQELLLPTTERRTIVTTSPSVVRRMPWAEGQTIFPVRVTGEGGGAGDPCEGIPCEERAEVDSSRYGRVHTR